MYRITSTTCPWHLPPARPASGQQHPHARQSFAKQQVLSSMAEHRTFDSDHAPWTTEASSNLIIIIQLIPQASQRTGTLKRLWQLVPLLQLDLCWQPRPVMQSSGCLPLTQVCVAFACQLLCCPLDFNTEIRNETACRIALCHSCQRFARWAGIVVLRV